MPDYEKEPRYKLVKPILNILFILWLVFVLVILGYHLLVPSCDEVALDIKSRVHCRE